MNRKNNNQQNNNTPQKSQQTPKRGKPLKRLNNNVRNNKNQKFSDPRRSPRTSPMSGPPPQRQNDYQNDLEEFIALRHSDTSPSTSKTVSAIPSQDLIWKRDDSGNQQQLEASTIAETSNKSIPIDDEIEEGEIVEQEVEDIVDLLQQSIVAVNNSRNVGNWPSAQKSSLFFEDRAGVSGQIPKYNTFNDPSRPVERTSSDDVICLDSSLETTRDDSVIFVSEEKRLKVRKKLSMPKLAKPDCLKSPAVNNLLNLVPLQLSPKKKSNKGSKPINKEAKQRKRKRYEAYKVKRNIEFAALRAQGLEGNVIDVEEDDYNGSSTEEDEVAVVASTSATVVATSAVPTTLMQSPQAIVASTQKEKRIVLIDGPNVAMQYNDVHKGQRTDKDFSAEGKF